MTADETRAQLLAQIRNIPSHTRKKRRNILIAWTIGGILLSLIAFAAVGGVRPTLRSPEMMALTASGTALFAGASVWMTLGRRNSGLGASIPTLVGMIIAVPVLILVWKVGWSSLYVGGVDWAPERPGFRCLGVSHLVGLPLLFTFLAIRRQTEPRHPQLTAAALGAAAGAVAAFLVDLWCPVGHPIHLLLGHVLPMISLATLGALLGARIVVIRGS